MLKTSFNNIDKKNENEIVFTSALLVSSRIYFATTGSSTFAFWKKDGPDSKVFPLAASSNTFSASSKCFTFHASSSAFGRSPMFPVG